MKMHYKPHYTTSANFMYWFDFAVINLKYIVDAIAKIGLVKNAELKLKMYVNTGAISVKVYGANTVDCSYGAITTTFANTCPMTVNLLTGAAGDGGFVVAGDSIVACLYICKPPSSFNGGGAFTAQSLTQLGILYLNILFITQILNLTTNQILITPTLTVLRKLFMQKYYMITH